MTLIYTHSDNLKYYKTEIANLSSKSSQNKCLTQDRKDEKDNVEKLDFLMLIANC